MDPAGRGPGRPRTMPLEDRRALVLEQAVTVFAREGYTGATIDSIAAGAGVAKPAIYELFASKDALFEAAAADELERFADHVVAGYASAAELEPAARTRARVEAVFRYAETRSDGLRLLLLASHHPGPGMRERFDLARAAVTDRLADVIAAELSAAGRSTTAREAQALAVLATEATSAVALRSFLDERWDAEATMELVGRFLAGGFASLLTPERDTSN